MRGLLCGDASRYESQTLDKGERMKYVCYLYYTTFITLEVEADSQEEAYDKANEQEGNGGYVTNEEIFENLERLEDYDVTHLKEED
jgi:hypothetical protein